MKIKDYFNKITAQLNDYLLLIISLTTIFGAGVYYLYALNWLGVILVLVLVIAAVFSLSPYLFGKSNNKNYLILNKKYLILLLLYLLFAGLAGLELFTNESIKALISPWQVVDYRFFLFYFLASVILVIALVQKKFTPTGKLFLLSVHYLLSFSVAIIIYKIGYGFDPFIHQATMELIDKKGLVTPKPPYYLGQYSLIIIFHKISGLSIYFLNKILVPLLSAFFLPVTIYRFLEKTSDSTTNSAAKFLAILGLLSLTFTPFIVTTPQNLTYLFLILTVLNGLNRTNPAWVLILALATLAIHPLTGIPAILFGAYVLFKKYRLKIGRLGRKIIPVFIFSANALILPVALLLTDSRNSQKFNPGLKFLVEPFKDLFMNLSLAGREDWLMNFIYFFAANYNLILIALIISSLIYVYRRKSGANWPGIILINSSLVLAYIFASQIRFNDLINYEQTSYASRILILITIFFLPFIITASQGLVATILKTEKINRLLWLAFGLALLLISLYVSYPRFDKYFNSRGYSVSNNDILAVRTINQNTNQPYIALANQAVSAAALKEFGFDHYYQTPAGPIYFYPIPTGGELYQYYLAMVYKNPSRSIMGQALDLAGVSEGYLIVNKYWYQSARVINAAKLAADSWQTVNDDVYIFQYNR